MFTGAWTSHSILFAFQIFANTVVEFTEGLSKKKINSYSPTSSTLSRDHVCTLCKTSLLLSLFIYALIVVNKVSSSILLWGQPNQLIFPNRSQQLYWFLMSTENELQKSLLSTSGPELDSSNVHTEAGILSTEWKPPPSMVSTQKH